MEYKFNKIIQFLYEDVKEGLVFLVEAFDEHGDIVNVKMTEQEMEDTDACKY